MRGPRKRDTQEMWWKNIFAGEHIIEITANVWAVEFSNHADNPLIPTWTSTKGLSNDFDYGGCSHDLDAETGQGHSHSEGLNDHDIVTGLNEILPMLEDNTHQEEDQYTRKPIHSKARSESNSSLFAICGK